MQWKLQRNCAMTPGQLMVGLVVVMLPSLLVGVGFLVTGIPWVTLFSGIEVVIFAIAFVCYARSAGDVEWVRISGEHVEVQVRSGSALAHEKFHRAFLSISMNRQGDNLLTLQESGRSIALGRTVPRHLRADLYRVLRSAVSWSPLQQGVQWSRLH
jgi:uncharacterized membrane protein